MPLEGEAARKTYTRHRPIATGVWIAGRGGVSRLAMILAVSLPWKVPLAVDLPQPPRQKTADYHSSWRCYSEREVLVTRHFCW